MSVNGGFEFLLLCGGDAFEAAGCSAGDYLGVLFGYAAEFGGLCGLLLVDFGEGFFFFGLFKEGIGFFFDVGLPVESFDDFCAFLGRR